MSTLPSKEEQVTLNTFLRGLWEENPVFVMLLGMCPTLGVTSTAFNGLGMGIATLFVLLMSNIVVSIIKELAGDVRDDLKNRKP